MRTQKTHKAALLVSAAFLLACPFAASVAAPLQSAFPTSTLVSGTPVKLSSTSPTLAHHSTPKVIETPAPTVAPAKQHDKKTIGRCWNRLMDMMREVRQAHHNKK